MLRLKKERMAELTTDELNRVGGGDDAITTAAVCVSVFRPCQSWRYCTTAISCGCEPTWNCA